MKDDVVAFSKRNELDVDYMDPPEAYLCGSYIGKGVDAIFETDESCWDIAGVSFGMYIHENVLHGVSGDEDYVENLLAFHIGVVLEGGPYAQKAKDKLYGFAERIKGKAPKMKELIDVLLSAARS